MHYVTKLTDAYKVSGDAFYTQNEKSVLPLGTLTVEETKAPDGYLLDGAYMQAGDSTEQIKGMYLTQITEDGELAVLSGSNQYSVSDQVIRGGVKIQKRDLETKDTKAQGSATLKDTAFAIISLNENPVLVEGKLYKKNETVKTIQTGIDGVATTPADLLPYGKYKLEESKAPEGYLTDGAKAIEFSITENGKIVDLTGESHSIYNQIKRGDLEGVKIGAGTHKRLANVPFKITSKTTGESHIIVTDKNGQFSTASDWASHKKNTNAGTSSEDGIWFGTSEPDDSKGALLYDTYEIEELACESNKGMKLIPAFEVVVSRNKVTVGLGTLTDEYEKEISIHTTATDKKTGEKVIVAGKKVTIVDVESSESNVLLVVEFPKGDQNMENELEVVNIRLVREPSLYSEQILDSPQAVVELMAKELSQYDREVFCILNMKNNGQVINMNLVSVGTINASLVIPREVFKSSILANASAIIGLHNHPSGNVKPSKEDMIVTRKLQKCGQLLGIELLDHIIVGGTNGKMLSFREEKMLNVTGRMDWER